jgi:hypothetical protein
MYFFLIFITFLLLKLLKEELLLFFSRFLMIMISYFKRKMMKELEFPEKKIEKKDLTLEIKKYKNLSQLIKFVKF